MHKNETLNQLLFLINYFSRKDKKKLQIYRIPIDPFGNLNLI